MNGFKKIKNIALVIIAFTIIFSTSLIEVYACSNKGCGCRAHSITSCAGSAKCYVIDEGKHCSGHQWGSKSSSNSTTGSPTCTGGAYETTTTSVTVTCSLCGHTFGPYKSTTSTYKAPLGHQLSGWNYNSSSHWKNCTRPVGHSGSDQFDRGAHNFTNWYQNNDGYRHKYCTTCGYSEKEPNKLTIRFDANGGSNAPGSVHTTFNNYVDINARGVHKDGYEFKGWGSATSWTPSGRVSGYAADLASYGGGNLYNNYEESITLYAQWERKVNYTFHYYNDLSHSAASQVITFIYHNYDTQYTLSVPNFKTVVDHNLSNDWLLRGFSQDSGFQAVREYWPNDVITLPVKNSSGAFNTDKTFYASYQRLVKMDYIDYGDNHVYEDKKQSNNAYLMYNGITQNPTFQTYAIRDMYYTEPDSAGNAIKERWNTRGWSYNSIPSYNIINENARKADASVGFSQGQTIITNKDHKLYALYEKNIKTTLNSNGGAFRGDSSYVDTYRNASAYCPTNNNYGISAPSTTKPEKVLPNVYYDGNEGLIKYKQGAWNHSRGLINQDFAQNMNITKDWNTHYPTNCVMRNNFTGNYEQNTKIWNQYYPLVNETLYATWTNQTEQVRQFEPSVTVKKTAVWNNPAGDDITVDYDNLQNIDIDGIARVTITVNVKNASGKTVGLKDFKIEDYYDTSKWDWYSQPNFTTGAFGKNSGNITWIFDNKSYADSANETYTLTYYLKLKEPYWTIDDTGKEVKANINYYINPMASGSNITSTYTEGLNKYLASLNSDGSMNRNNFNYCNSTYTHKSYCYAIYTIMNTELNGTQRYVAYPSDSVVMRPVNWRPTVPESQDKNGNKVGVGIESDTNNIYHHLWDGYFNTYFVKYDTHSNLNSSDSPFRIFMNSQVRRSYSFYQITNNIFDLRSVKNTQDILDNSIGHSMISSTTWNRTTNSKLLSGFSAKEILGVNFVKSIRTPVTTEGYKYPYGAVSTYDTVYSTNQDGLRSSIYPFIRTTNTLDGRTFETTRSDKDLVNKRLDIIIDATNPIVTDDKRIKYESADGTQQWTDSDGYMDINLVDNYINPMPKTHVLTFAFKDEVSGVNSPLATDKDWINRINDNVQVKLVNTDSGKIIFDSATMEYDNNQIIKAEYADTASFNKSGKIEVTLNPENDDLLGHLQLTVKIIDNVTNYTEKIYDIYSFCLTGEIRISDTLPDYAERNWTEFINGEMGKVYVEADGYVDRVDVNFGAQLTKASEREFGKRNNISNDSIYSINGDYPYDDYKAVSYKDSADSNLKYLPKEWQKVRWGHIDSELAGVRLTDAYLDVINNTYVENDILNKNLSEMIKRYQDMQDGKEVDDIKEPTYAIIKDTLYTYPVYNGDTIKSYINSYKIGGTLIMEDMKYPEYVIIDGNATAYIEYERIVVKPDKKKQEVDDTDLEVDVYEIDEAENSEVEEIESIESEKIIYKASIESQTAIGSQWVQTGDAILRPFIHYFYMPLYAEVKNVNDPHYAILTAFKDSDKDFVHFVKVKLSFTNEENPLGNLQTIIKDN